MGRGFLSGVFWGAIVAGFVLIVASRVGGYLDLKLPEPEAAAVALPAGTEFNRERPDETPVLPQTEGRPENSAAPTVVMPEPATEPTPDTTPLETPETTPLDEAALVVPDTTVVAVPEVGAGNDTDPDAPDGADRPHAPDVDSAPDHATAAATPDAGDVPDDIASPAPEPDAPPAALPVAPRGIRLPVPQIEDMVPGVTTDRLPRIGAEPDSPRAPGEPALRRFAVPFERTPGIPLMAIVLLDMGSLRADPQNLAGFPLPLGIAIDPLADDATEVMAAYRAAGVEVLNLTPVPQGAAPADVEVAFQGFHSAVPEAVAVLDLPGAVLQESRPRAAQVIEILAEFGQGLITYDHGLNAALQVAKNAGVHAALVFREFDDGQRDGASMKRFLDQGGFRAAQDGTVIMVGRLRPETLAALAEWRLGSRAATLTLAPVSAVLQAR